MNDAFLWRQQLDGRSKPSFESKTVSIGTYEIIWRGYIADPNCIDTSSRFASSYKRWNSELARHVFGQFAVAIYDYATDTLFATHDDFGTVPLFYAEVEGELIISSHLHTIVQRTGLRKLDEEFIADYIGEGWHFGPRTPYAHIRRLMPSESLSCRNGNIWILTGANLTEEPLSVGETRALDERLLELVTEAVAGAIHPGERVWCELSGGLDSSTVFSLAARANTSKVAALSCIYSRTTRCDESEWIRDVLDMYPAPWYTLDADEMRPFTDLPVHQYAEPMMKLFMNKKEEAYHRLLADNDVDVMLSGEGGDGIFLAGSAQPYHLADYFRRGRLDLGLSELGRWTKSSRQKRPSMYWFLRYVLRPSLRHLKHEMLEYELIDIPWIDPDYAKRMGLRKRGRKSWAVRRKTVAASAYMEGVMRGAFAAAMSYQDPHHACQFRHPLLYRPLVEFMQRVPWIHQIAPEGDRTIQRRALAGVLPEPIRERVSKVAGSPWLYSGLREGTGWRDRLTHQPRIVARGYAIQQGWLKAVQDSALGKTVGIRLFLASATLEAWLQELETPMR